MNDWMYMICEHITVYFKNLLFYRSRECSNLLVLRTLIIAELKRFVQQRLNKLQVLVVACKCIDIIYGVETCTIIHCICHEPVNPFLYCFS